MEEIETEQVSKRPRLKSDYNSNHYTPYFVRRVLKKYKNTDEKKLRQAVKMYFDLCRDDLAMGYKVNLQNKLGNLYLNKEKKEVFLDSNGKIINKLPVNIRDTSELWKTNPELKGKVFVRYINDHSDNCVFSLHYEVSKAVFKNKNIYTFVFNRGLKKELSSNIMDKKVDAFLKKYKDE